MPNLTQKIKRSSYPQLPGNLLFEHFDKSLGIKFFSLPKS